MSYFEEFIEETEYLHRKYYIESKNVKVEIEASEYIKINFPEIFEKSRHGDFIEDGSISGYRSDGLYIIDKKYSEFKIRPLSTEPDEYGSIPSDYLGFRDFIPGFQIDIEEDPRCKSFWHNMHCPVDLNFLRTQNINDFSFTNLIKYSSFEYKGKRVLVLYPYSYLLESTLEIDYFDLCVDGIENYIDTIENDETFINDNNDNETYSKIDEFSENFDIILGPMQNFIYQDEDEDEWEDIDE